ncbi:Mitochondrial intermembrane space import and assembly protein 40-like protein [Thalictrum thalictroides]|uniref:Mitochondrial intermembrane space import and assembly protein 40-like protein n=1 Tax=Thalictrum thalictroides TaxID=46969 RepID=A0A7J6WW35_THATH|nr:Mitochondrial intermembrane space import and assembly protein 40-like protein [Thalictrum thalictroides]
MASRDESVVEASTVLVSQSLSGSSFKSSLRRPAKTPPMKATVDQNTKPDSLEALIAEATAFGDSEDESLDAKAQKALDCPCVAGLRNGPCGTPFSEAFLCFLKSTAEEKALPGPRVGQSSLPWLLAVPLAYAGITFVVAFVRTVNKFTSPKHKRRKLVNKNATLCKSIDELFEKGRDQLQHSALLGLVQKTGFGMQEILRKYIRYAMNEKPFNPDMVADLIQLRKASLLDDTQVAEILNDISRRIVADKGPVVMDISGYSEKGFKRKLAVQALFGKIFYLSELPEFCSKESSLIIKEIFGVTDEDAITLRTHTLSEAGDVDSLDKMVGNSDSDQSDEESVVSSQE